MAPLGRRLSVHVSVVAIAIIKSIFSLLKYSGLICFMLSFFEYALNCQSFVANCA